jgi:pheromone shutdown protein TraB
LILVKKKKQSKTESPKKQLDRKSHQKNQKKQEKKPAFSAVFVFFVFFVLFSCFFLDIFFLDFGFLVCFFFVCSGFAVFYYVFVKPYILCVAGLINLEYGTIMVSCASQYPYVGYL